MAAAIALLLVQSIPAVSQASTSSEELLLISVAPNQIISECREVDGYVEACSDVFLVNIYYESESPSEDSSSYLRGIPKTLISYFKVTQAVSPELCNPHLLGRSLESSRTQSLTRGGVVAGGLSPSLSACFSSGINANLEDFFILLWQNGEVIGWASCDFATCEINFPEVLKFEETGRTAGVGISLFPVKLIRAFLLSLNDSLAELIISVEHGLGKSPISIRHVEEDTVLNQDAEKFLTRN